MLPSPSDPARRQRQSGHQVELLQGSQSYFSALVHAIEASVHEVRFETYIFDVHGAGRDVAAALEHAAMRGVAVTVVVDGVGTPELSAPWPQRWRLAGVQWRVFAPLGNFGLMVPSRWRRMHRKLCVVDGEVAFCGGINVLDDGYDPNHGLLSAPRFDFAVRVTGPLVQQAHVAMSQLWWRLQAAQKARQVDWEGAWAALRLAVQAKRELATNEAATEGAWAELVLRDNLRFRTRIERAYLHALAEAKQDIVLANAYFLPGRKMRAGLINAAQRGVRVRLLLQGRYEYFMQYHATRALYAPLLAAGVEIYEYQPSFLHAKVAVVDDQWATVGSSNIDPLSLLLAREANVVVQDEPFAKALKSALETALTTVAQRVNPVAHASRHWRLKLLDALAYLVLRSLLFINGKRY